MANDGKDKPRKAEYLPPPPPPPLDQLPKPRHKWRPEGKLPHERGAYRQGAKAPEDRVTPYDKRVKNAKSQEIAAKILFGKNKGRRKLTPLQKRFVAEYMIDFNAAAAARRAGAPGKGYALSKSPTVRHAITQRLNRLQERTEVHAEKVIREFARIAFLDPAELFTEHGTLKTLEEMDEDARHAIAGMEVLNRSDGAELVRIKLHDKRAALDSLGRHLGLFKDVLVPSNPDGTPWKPLEMLNYDNLHRELEGIRGPGSAGHGPDTEGTCGDV